jgi:ABC-type lipoprotein export system ATPase subunit
MNDRVLIEMQSVSRYYEDGRVVALEDVNVKVAKGEFLVVKGPSASGKSTLLHLMGGLDSPSTGEIRFAGLSAQAGKSLKDALKTSRFRIHNIGFVFQAFYLWQTLNVLENVLLPLMESKLKKAERVERAKSLISLMGLEKKSLSSVAHLSMGERQRVAIARALVMNPALLLADEPTGSLDSKNAENVINLFGAIKKDRGVTIVMATHEKMSYGFFDRELYLLDGRLQ